MKIPSLLDKSFSSVLNAVLSLLTNQLEFNSREYWTDWLTTPATAGDRLVVSHKLGTVPTGYELKAVREDGLLVWHKEADEAFWTTTEIVVRFSAGGIKFRMTVEAKD